MTDMKQAMTGADVIMMLRIQRERLDEDIAMSLEDYVRLYGLTRDKLPQAKPVVIIMHPGPMNRGVEIADDVADDPRVSVILEQVEMGVAIRMACFDLLLTKK
jgi:aspartate carbamoyltransferase catalytic subunit